MKPADGATIINDATEVKMGSRTADNEKAAQGVKGTNVVRASQGTFADAAAFGEILFNCTAGMASLNALRMAGPANLKDKILIDIANPLDFSRGMPTTLAISNTDSLGEQVRKAFPDVKVVETLNTMNCHIMVNPSLVPGEHDVFVCGNDAEAKAVISRIPRDWFWLEIDN
jgi:hypothetical protein